MRDGNDSFTIRYYGNGLEKAISGVDNIDYLTYLCHGDIVVHHEGNSDGLRSAPPTTPTAILQGYYDAQGSLVALVDENGNVVRRYAYDPWGKRVKPTNWTQPDTSEDLYHINRGYTMHEHLDDFELINMNGRVFDPAVAQFLSPDNYVQDPYNWMNYNRYAYCWNNPLKYSDPSGNLPHLHLTPSSIDFYYRFFETPLTIGLKYSWATNSDNQKEPKISIYGGLKYQKSFGRVMEFDGELTQSLDWNFLEKELTTTFNANILVAAVYSNVKYYATAGVKETWLLYKVENNKSSTNEESSSSNKYGTPDYYCGVGASYISKKSKNKNFDINFSAQVTYGTTSKFRISDLAISSYDVQLNRYYNKSAAPNSLFSKNMIDEKPDSYINLSIRNE